MKLTLTDSDRHNPLWKRMVDHCEARITELQNKLSGDMPEEESWKYRGRIAELRAILERNNQPVEIEMNSADSDN